MVTLISLVSEQTIPNTLFIFEKKQLVNRYLFVTTEKMEILGKTNAIADACGLKLTDIEKLIINQDHPADVKSKFQQWIDNQTVDQEYIVHLTGGNKTTMLVVQNLMSKYTDKFYYLPIDKQVFACINKDFEVYEEPVVHKLGLNTYLKACGLYYSEKEVFDFTEAHAFEIFDRYKKLGFDPTSFPYQLAQRHNLSYITPENLMGLWFENYLYYWVKRELNLNQESVSQSVYIYQTEQQETNDQEIDLLFVFENKLYQVECKVSLGKTPREKAINDLFKMGAITSRFGLSTISVFLTLSSLRTQQGRHSNSFMSKLKLLGINHVADGNDFGTPDFNFKKFINKKRVLA